MLRITDAIDMHCHYGPDVVAHQTDRAPHSVTGLEAAREALATGYKAIVLKSHSIGSPPLAFAVEQAVPGLRVFGGICTDYPTGGLNVEAVDAALRLGGKIVWLPTIHSHQEVLNGNSKRFSINDQGLFVIGEDGKVTQEVREVFALIREHNAILATGHTTAAEHYAVVKEFGSVGRVIVTHAGELGAGPHLTGQQCKELADLGAMIELTSLTCERLRQARDKDPMDLIATIQAVGCDRCTLSSDYGFSTAYPRPAPGLRDFLETLWSLGVTEEMLNTMVSKNPARMLDV